MVIGSRWRDMVGGFFGENRGIVGEFRGESLFRFRFFGGSGEFCSGGDFGNLFF